MESSWQFEFREQRSMVGELPPGHAVQHTGLPHGETALVDTVEAQPGESSGECARRWGHAGAPIRTELVYFLRQRFGPDGHQRIAQAAHRTAYQAWITGV